MLKDLRVISSPQGLSDQGLSDLGASASHERLRLPVMPPQPLRSQISAVEPQGSRIDSQFVADLFERALLEKNVEIRDTLLNQLSALPGSVLHDSSSFRLPTSVSSQLSSLWTLAERESEQDPSSGVGQKLKAHYLKLAARTSASPEEALQHASRLLAANESSDLSVASLAVLAANGSATDVRKIYRLLPSVFEVNQPAAVNILEHLGQNPQEHALVVLHAMVLSDAYRSDAKAVAIKSISTLARQYTGQPSEEAPNSEIPANQAAALLRKLALDKTLPVDLQHIAIKEITANAESSEQLKEAPGSH